MKNEDLPEEIELRTTAPESGPPLGGPLRLRMIAFRPDSADVVAAWFNPAEAAEWLSRNGYERVNDSPGEGGIWSRSISGDYKVTVCVSDEAEFDFVEIVFHGFHGTRSQALELSRAKFSLHADLFRSGRKVILKDDAGTKTEIKRN